MGRTARVIIFITMILIVSLPGCKFELESGIHSTPFKSFQKAYEEAETGNWKEALRYYNQAIAMDSTFVSAYYNRGCVKTALGDYAGAYYDFDKALDIRPYDGASFYNRGIIKFFLEDRSGACRDWSQAEKLGMLQAVELLNNYCK